MKTALLLLAALVLFCCLRFSAATAAAPPVLADNSNGRFAVVAVNYRDTGGDMATFLRLDTSTGEAWLYEREMFRPQGLSNAVQVAGWIPVPASYSQQLQGWLAWKPGQPVP